MWVNITKIEQHGRYEVQMNTETSKIRYREIYGTAQGEWRQGDPPEVNKGMNADAKTTGI